MTVSFKVMKGGAESVSKGDLFLMFSEEQMSKLRKSSAKSYEKEIALKISKKEFSGENGQSTTLHMDELRFHLVGLGKEKELDIEMIRKTGADVAGKALCLKTSDFSVVVDLPKLKVDDSAGALADGILLGSYKFDKYKTEKKDEKIKLKNVAFVVPSDIGVVEKTVKFSEITCASTNYVRDLQMENADIVTPEFFEKEAKKLSAKHKLKITVLDCKKLKAMGANLILAVGKGSKTPPRIIILEYKGNPGSKDSTAVIGKGITFDSGGLNLKPTNYIETMREDMTGAAVVLGTLQAAASLNLKKNIIGVLSTAENAIGSGAYKPGDVYKSLSGKTVEIGNTDAEGRLVLADAMTYTEKNLKPSRMIDVATLTGSVLVTFGDYVAGMCGTNKKMMKALSDSGEKTYERVWELPLYKEYLDEVKSETADLNNINYGRNAGSIMAAAFLSKFVEKTPWVHLDIAGTSWLENARGYYQKGATGFGVRLLIDYISNN
tara:strand:+ start:5313 stop:6788 length:1476 start_codon:yes stop_codon:yes gene_type:complete